MLILCFDLHLFHSARDLTQGLTQGLSGKLSDNAMTSSISAQLQPTGKTDDFGRHLEMLVGVTQEFATSLDLDETLQHSAERVRELLSAEASSLFLLEDGQLVCRAASGPIDITGLTLALDQGIIGRTVRHNRPFMVRDVKADSDFAGTVDQTTGFITRSILSVPLRVKQTCIGALELINKADRDGLFNQHDQEVLMALASLAALAIHNARMAGALVEQERLRHELALARVIQSSLLPTPMKDPCCIAGLNLPAREVSGDFFDYMPLGDGRLAFNLADVAGKGMDAALLMAKTSSLLRCLGKQLTRPDELLARVNDELCETATRGKFVTVVAGVLDPVSGEVVLANAGHQPPLLHRGGNDFIEFPAPSPPIGVIPGLSFPITRLTLGESALYLFTDGLTEAKDDDGRSVEVTGVQHLIHRFASLPKQERIEHIADAIAGNGGKLHDDITLLVLEGASPTQSPHHRGSAT